MQRHVEYFHYLFSTRLANSSSACLNNFGQRSICISFGKKFFKSLRHVLDSHFFEFPIRSN